MTSESSTTPSAANPPGVSAANPPGVSAGLADAVQRVAASVVAIDSGHRHAGSGIVWRDAVVVTAASAVQRASRLRVVMPDGEHVQGELKGVDIGTDLAAIAVPTGALAAAARAEPGVQRVGDLVFAAGRDRSGMLGASFGHIGAVAGPWRSWRGARIDRLVRLDGGLYPGLDGAAVADAQGALIGLASSAFSRMHGVVVPADTIDRVVAQLLAQGHVSRGYFGIGAQTAQLDDATRQALGTDAREALLVTAVARGGPAGAAGLRVGDLIVAVAGRPLATIDDLRELLGDASAGAAIGERVSVRIARGGEPRELSIEVAARPRGVCG